MTRADELLRATIDELASEARGVDNLAAMAMARGRRIRLRRRLTISAGVVVMMLAAIAVPYVVLQPAGGPTPPAGATSGPVEKPAISELHPRPLAGGWVVTGVGDWVLDREQNKYTKLTVSGRQPLVLPSPMGYVAAIVYQNAERSGYVIDFIATDGTPVQNQVNLRAGGTFQWSPRGDRLVTKVAEVDRGTGALTMQFAVIDAYNDNTVRKHPIDLSRYDCSACEFVWTRDGREIAMAIADRRGGEASERVSSVQLFDAETGAPTRSLAMKAMFTSPYAWSPNGRYVIAQPDRLKQEFQLVDTTTGQATPFPYDAVWVTEDLLVATINDIRDPSSGARLLTLRPDGTVVEEIPLDGAFKDAGPVSLGPPARR